MSRVCCLQTSGAFFVKRTERPAAIYKSHSVVELRLQRACNDGERQVDATSHSTNRQTAPGFRLEPAGQQQQYIVIANLAGAALGARLGIDVYYAARAVVSGVDSKCRTRTAAA